MEWDKKTKIIAGSGLGVLLLVLIVFLNSEDDPVPVDPEPAPKVVFKPIDEKKEEQKLPEQEERDLNLQTQFNKLVEEIRTDVKKCQDGVSSLFPQDRKPDEPLPYRTVPEIKKAIDDFYTLVGDKIESTRKVTLFFKDHDHQALDPKQTFELLSKIEDCGDFEEESIIDSITYFISDYNFPPAEKKAVAKHILKNFKDQLKLDLGLHHIVSKVESLESLIEEGLLPIHHREDVNRLQQTVELAEEDFRRVLPVNMNNKEFVSPKEVLELKEREDEILERVKTALNDVINQLETSL